MSEEFWISFGAMRTCGARSRSSKEKKMFPSRIFSAFFMAVFALALTACSSGKPESTVETFYEAAAKGDVEKATEQISFSSVPAAQMMAAKGKVQMIVGEMQARIQANDGLDSVEILESKINEEGKLATVRSKVKFKNGKEQTENHRLIKEDDSWKILLK